MGGPASLIQSGVYRLPPGLAIAYRDELAARSLVERARSRPDSAGVYGGESAKSADDHFAWRFQNSALRPAYLLLTQAKALAAPQAHLLAALFSHTVSVLDLAAGTGAGTLSLLSVVHELRLANLVPTLPLTIEVLGADYSTRAREIFDSMCDRVAPELSKSAITLIHRSTDWDARDSASTMTLCNQWLKTKANEHLILVNNFSGEGMSITDDLKFSWKCIGDLLVTSSAAKRVTWTWLESENKRSGKFLERVAEFFAERMKQAFPDQYCADVEEYRFHELVRATEDPITSGVVVHQHRR